MRESDTVNRPSPRAPRAELLQVVLEAARRHSTATVLFHAAVAEHLGLNLSDHKCADLIARRGPMTAGELAELSGLSTGAITGVIDRLEGAGFVRRDQDPEDRRRVIVHLVPDSPVVRKATAVFESLSRAAARALAGYTDEELSLLLDFFARVETVLQEQAAKL